mgnify:CR=1 FL=1
MISLLGVDKEYDGLRALSGVSLSIEEGEIFGLIGPNGAGKTTLIRILSGRTAPTRGEIFFQGEKVDARHPGYRSRIGLVPQEPACYGRLTARENLGLMARLYGLGWEEAIPRVEELLSWSGLMEHADRQARHFSRGMLQRLSLAMGMMHSPAVIFMDEPTSGLDPEARSSLLELISRLSGEGKTVLVTTHNMEEADHICSRIAILVKGRVREVGSPREIKGLLGADRLELSLEDGAEGALSSVCGRLGLAWRREGDLYVVTGEDIPGKLPEVASGLAGSLRDLHYRGVTLEDAFLRFMREVGE